MSEEREINFAPHEVLNLKNKEKLDRVVAIFAERMDSVRRGDKQEEVLFEGDIDFRNINPEKPTPIKIFIDKETKVDREMLTRKFKIEMIKVGEVTNTQEDIIRVERVAGKTNEAKLRRIFGDKRYPMERSLFIIKPQKASRLLVRRDVYYSEFKTVDGKQIPFLPKVERWTVGQFLSIQPTKTPTENPANIPVLV